MKLAASKQPAQLTVLVSSRRRFVALVVSVFCAFGILPAVGAIERVAGTAPDRVTETITAPSGRMLVTLRNTAAPGQPGSDSPVQLRAHAMFSSLVSGNDTRADWLRLDTGRGPDADRRFQLARGETATFEVRGTFATAGIWETAIEALDTAGNITSRVVLAIERRMPVPPAVPNNLLAEPRVARIGLGPWNARTAAPHSIRLQARNQGTEALTLTLAGIGQVTTAAGAAEQAAALEEAFSVSSTDCSGQLGAGQGCTLTLAVPVGLAPGRYVAEVMVSGAGGGQSLRAQTVEVRASAWWAGALAALGALLGALVTGWRTTGRQLVEARIFAAERRRQAGLLEAATNLPAARRSIAHLMDRLRELDGTIRRGKSNPDLAPHDERLQAIAAAVEAHALAERIPPEQGQALAAAKEKLAKALDAAALGTVLKPEASQAILTVAAALRELVAAVEALVRAAAEADADLTLVGPSLCRLLELEGKLDELPALKDARAAAFLPARDAEELAKRTPEIRSAIVALRKALSGTAVPEAIVVALCRLHAAATEEDQRRDFAEAVAKAERLASRWPTLPAEVRLREADRFAEAILSASARAPDGRTESAAAPAQPPIPALLPAGSPMTLDLDGLLSGPSRLASLDELEGFRTLWSWLTNIAVLIGIGAAAVPILWADNPVWGSSTDLIAALLAGIGTRLAIGTVASRS